MRVPEMGGVPREVPRVERRAVPRAEPVDSASLSGATGSAAGAPTGGRAAESDACGARSCMGSAVASLDADLALRLAHPALHVPGFAREAWRFLFHPRVDASVRQRLMDEAADPSNAAKAWTPGAPLSDARNAHYTNTADQMLAALQGDFNYLEGDFRLEAGVRRLPVLDHWREPIAAHDTGDVHGLSLAEWLDVGAATGRGLKMDIKQAAAVPKIIDAVKARGIPDERLMFNADVIRGPGGKSPVVLAFARVVQDLTCTVDDLKQIRRAFPDAVISLGAYTGRQPPGTRYSSDQIDRFKAMAAEVGGPFHFVLRAEFVDAAVVARLKGAGRVGIWNDPSTYSPPDVDLDAKRFRSMGVDGVIDLRQA